MATTTDAQVGDKIELLYAGTVERIDEGGFIHTSDGLFSTSHRGLVSIRVVELAKKQFKVGDIVKSTDYYRLPVGAVVLTGSTSSSYFKTRRGWVERGEGHHLYTDSNMLGGPRTLVYLPE